MEDLGVPSDRKNGQPMERGFQLFHDWWSSGARPGYKNAFVKDALVPAVEDLGVPSVERQLAGD